MTASLYVGRRYAYHVGPGDLSHIAAAVAALAAQNPNKVIRAKLSEPDGRGGLRLCGEIVLRPATTSPQRNRSPKP